MSIRLAGGLVAGWCMATLWCAKLQAQAETGDLVTYDQVRPVFRKHCVTCHNQDRARGDLNLSSMEGIKAGSSSGTAAVVKKPDESPIYLLPAHLEAPKMPPNSPKIPQRELDLIRRWIEGGMVERGAVATTARTSSKPAPAATDSSSVVGSPPAAAEVAIEPLIRSAPITALAVSPSAPLVAVSGRKQVVLFQLQDQKPWKAFAFPEGDVFDLQFSRDGKLLLAGGGVGGLSGKVVAFEVATGKRVFEVGDETDVVLALAISPDASLVALGGPGRSVKVFRPTDGQLVATLRKHTDWILSVDFSPDGVLLASSDRFGAVQVWEARSGKEFHTLRGHAGPAHALSWSAESDRLLSASEDGTLRWWNMHDGTQIRQLDGGVGAIIDAECDSTGRVTCCGRNGRIAVWDSSGSQTHHVALNEEIGELALTHDASQLVVGDATGRVRIYRTQAGELAGQFTLPVAPETLLAKTIVASKAKTVIPAVNPSVANLVSSPLSLELAEAELAVRHAANELAATREASASADASVKLAEQSLAKLRESATHLHNLVATHELAAKHAAERLADLRRRAESRRAESKSVSTDLPQKLLLLSSELESVAAQLHRAQAAMRGDAPTATGGDDR